MGGDRSRLLQDVILRRRLMSDLADELSLYAWDSPSELALLRSDDVLRALHDYLDGALCSADLALWCECLAGRDDVGIEQERAEAIKQFLFQGSSPELFPLSRAFAMEWIDRLNYVDGT